MLTAHLSVIVDIINCADSAVCTLNIVSHEHQHILTDLSNNTVILDTNRSQQCYYVLVHHVIDAKYIQ